ncbi:MAG: DUF4091 domain-containing protein [Clostridia bacterium]|nr:DUF4091 domain-containing protein [Clostridia bacterium]
MKTVFGLCPESFKLVWGDLKAFNKNSVEKLPKEIELVAGKNDTAAFQLVVSADEAFALSLSGEPWFSQNALRKNLRAELEFPLESELKHIALSLCDDAFRRADALLDNSVVEADANGILSVFCEIKIPHDARKTSYSGKIRLFSSFGFEREELVGECNISLSVFNFVFPENKQNGFHLDLWQHPSNVARYYGVPLWSEAHFEILRKYCKTLGELGVKSVSVIASEIPWNGQGCQNEQRYNANFFEYSMIAVTRNRSGALEFDFSVMQRYIDLCAEYGIDECISVFGLVNIWDTCEYGGKRTAPDYPDGVHIRVFDEESGAFDYLRSAAEVDEYIKALESYYISTAQIDRVRIAADEPADIEAYRKSLEHIKGTAPAFKYKTAINHAEFVNEFGKDIYDFAPYISAMYSEYDALMQFKAEMPEKRFLYYVCCAPEIPNSFLRSELTDCYFIGALAAYAKMDGFLRWSYTVWTEDPLNDSRFGPFPAGDLCLVYPAKNGAPLLTLRWKALYRGIKLFVLLKEAEKRSLNEALERAYSLILKERDIKKLYGVWERDKMMSYDYNDYREAEKALLSALEEKS